METSPPVAEQSLSHEVTRLSDAIHASERLCLLSARSVLRCAISLNDRLGSQAPLAFIPSISRDLQNVLPFAGKEARDNPHPTTSAHCITALQNLLPVIGRFQLGTHESKGLAFHPIERNSLDVFKPDALNGEIRGTIERALDGLDSQTKTKSRDKEDQGRSTFTPLHPFRAAQVLRALAPSHAVFGSVAWRSPRRQKGGRTVPARNKSCRICGAPGHFL
jgi:hypothetical protein